MDASGHCLCGAVQFTAQLPARWVAHCHCTRCQRAHGAAFVTWVGFEEGAVSVQAAPEALRWFVTPEGARRGFCAQCGSPMFFASPRYPGELHVARAAFATDLAQEPTDNVFFSTHAHWAREAYTLPEEPA